MRPGYILRTIDYKDNSKLLYLYTQSGIESLIARGVKKMNSPFRHMTQTQTLIDFDAGRGKLPTLKDAVLMDHFPDIKKDLIRTSVLSCVNELIYYNVTDHDNHEKLWQFLIKFTGALKKTSAPLELLPVFELKFLHFLGYGIGLRHCHVCKTRESLWFDLYEGALVCDRHKKPHHQNYDETVHRPLQYFYYCDITRFEPRRLDNKMLLRLYDVVDALHETHLGGKTKAKRMLRTLITGG